MKRRKEGTLDDVEYSSADGDDFDQALRETHVRSFCGMHDFLTKADALVAMMRERGPLSQQRARSLELDLARIRDALATGEGGEAALYAAICAGISYRNLMHEIHDDEQRSRKILRRTYWAAYRAVRGKKAAIAKTLGVTDNALLAWEKKNIVNLNRPK
jgi:hypothetical protein